MLIDDLRQITIDLIEQFGFDAVLTEVQLGSYDPNLGDVVETEVNHNVKVVYDNVSSVYLDRGDIQPEDRLAYIWFPSRVFESWKLDGQNIITVKRYGAQNDYILYELLVRGNDA
jgi:hypothetical protein